MKMKLFLLGCGLGLGVVSSGYAATATGTINATLNLTNNCLVNGQPGTTGINFGSLNFGTSPSTFTTLNASVAGSAGSGIYINCSAGDTYTVAITGSNTAPATVFGTVTSAPRYLISTTQATTAIAYTLYPTAASSTPIANNTNLTANGTPDPVLGSNYQIFGRITGGGDNAAIPEGTYTDVINVAITY
ncbi:spore coat protein U domain-containing protein [Erwinia tasmaniensis]|uniref:Membrane protein CsuA (Chaperone-usher pili assembly system) n=1 Tax=Erwinia tasmaniensis (strain DSM 17950 / CFBP 7177 / CIP 109463 / NCPPB 4357 / Et1/99) TaxID=465817 RepID=B2VGG9_ERWT9|nr:spore coat protein U domain-containing protein [Erwinia tasmaniensis]CAO95504.1 Putative membrane protein CsuA (chaperone-usher pili assembly system) [Erwinia tasmaniensis Et1/99]